MRERNWSKRENGLSFNIFWTCMGLWSGTDPGLKKITPSLPSNANLGEETSSVKTYLQTCLCRSNVRLSNQSMQGYLTHCSVKDSYYFPSVAMFTGYKQGAKSVIEDLNQFTRHLRGPAGHWAHWRKPELAACRERKHKPAKRYRAATVSTGCSKDLQVRKLHGAWSLRKTLREKCC